ncbi:hypothetical protein AX16_009824 [Volvariella volvacea WC 439]|nr:hypothetical protein AX16_009824 [Volvariella volvacea WC 439]
MSSSSSRQTPGLWFPDGNLRILNGNETYLLDGEKLRSRSAYFDELLRDQLPAKPGSDPPTLKFHDDPQDLRRFLEAIYDDSAFPPPPASTTLQLISSVLRLSTKYNAQQLRQRAILHLETAFPPDFKEWMNINRDLSFTYAEPDTTVDDKPFKSDSQAVCEPQGDGEGKRSIDEKPESHEAEDNESESDDDSDDVEEERKDLGPPPQPRLPTALEVYSLAINYDVPWILPGVFYTLFTHPLDTVISLLPNFIHEHPPSPPTLIPSTPIASDIKTAQPMEIDLPPLFSPPSSASDATTTPFRRLLPVQALGKFIILREWTIREQTKIAIDYLALAAEEINCGSEDYCHHVRVRAMNGTITGSHEVSSIPARPASTTEPSTTTSDSQDVVRAQDMLNSEICARYFAYRAMDYYANLRDMCPNCRRTWDEAYESNGRELWTHIMERFGLGLYMDARKAEFPEHESKKDGDGDSDGVSMEEN